MRNQDPRGNRWAYFDGRLDSKTDSNAGGQQWATGDEGGHTPGNTRLLCTSTLNRGHTEGNLIFLNCCADVPSLVASDADPNGDPNAGEHGRPSPHDNACEVPHLSTPADMRGRQRTGAMDQLGPFFLPQPLTAAALRLPPRSSTGVTRPTRA